MWLVPLKIVSNVARFKPALNLNRILADLNRGSNSLNSNSGYLTALANFFLFSDVLTRVQYGILKMKNLVSSKKIFIF